MELNSVLIMGFLDGNNFIIKFNKTKFYAYFKTYNDYSSLYSKYLKFLVL